MDRFYDSAVCGRGDGFLFIRGGLLWMSIGSDRCACYDVKSGLVDKIKYACWGKGGGGYSSWDESDGWMQ